MSAALLLVSTLAVSIAATVSWLLKNDPTDHTKAPSLLISSTFHSRFKPILHSFRYPILYICIDLDTIGYVDKLFTSSYKHWRLLSIRSDDYLGGKYAGTIKEKLWAHLKDHAIDTQHLSRALLITTPRLCGYAFNPVSFHFIYDVQDSLAVVVLEVNNTFDEKHIYVLPQADATEADRAGYSSQQTFPRRFHVSPFNDRSGSYKLLCKDPLAESSLSVSMHLTLLEPDGTKKLTAQVSSTDTAVPTTNYARCLWTCVFYGGAVFLTFPRILYQAKILHYAKKLGVYMRPEPFEDLGAIGRQAPSPHDLYFMHLLFGHLQANREWLQCKQIIFKLLPRAIDTDEVIIQGEGEGVLTITILSMTFFSSFVTSESPLTCLWTDSLALQTPLFRVSDEVLFLNVFCAGFSRALPGRWYLQDQRVKYRGRSSEFDAILQVSEPTHVPYLSATNRTLDNYVFDMALKNDISLIGYRYRVLMTLAFSWLGNAAFDALATFTGEDGRPKDEWIRVQAALRKRQLTEETP